MSISETDSKIRRGVTRQPLFENEPQTLPELFRQSIAKFQLPDALNFKADGEWHKISAAEMLERTENIALGFYALGLRKDDKAAILAANSPAWTLTDAGCQFVGIVDVPIYTTLAPDGIKYILNDSEARVLIVENAEMFERVKEILPDCAAIEKVIFFDDTKTENSVTLAKIEADGKQLKAEKPDLIEALNKAIEPEDLATLIYTSGTTGEPKGVMLSHANIISNVIDAGENFDFPRDNVALSVLPLTHVFERSAMYLYIYNGIRVFYAESIDKIADNLTEVRPTIFVGVPRIFEKVYAKAKQKAAQASPLKEKIFDWAIAVGVEYAKNSQTGEDATRWLGMKYVVADKIVFAKLREFFGGRLRFCITGGAALSDDIWLIFEGAGIPIMQGYGMTETSPVIASNNPLDARLGTVGKPIRNADVRIAEDGEIEVSTPGVMLGYYKKEAATRKDFTADGWLKTGDIGELDRDGFLKITDRKKELFKTSGGKYIAPAPIEQKIKASRYVNQVVLIGSERKFPAALIVPNFEALGTYAKSKTLNLKTPAEFCQSQQIIELLESEVEKACAELSNYEKVKKIALLENELSVETGEMTPTLKIKRRVIDEKFKQRIDEFYN